MSDTGGHNPESRSTGIPREWNAFCAFIEAHYRVLYTVALAHVRDAEVAQEITQDICVRLLLEREKLPPMENASGWMARVARNTAIDWVRRRQTHSRILAMMESRNHNPTAGNHTPADARSAAIMEEEKQRLYVALERIAPEDREMLLMYYLDGLEKQDIARLLEIHPSTVGRRIDKALRELKISMAEFEPSKLRALRPAEHTSTGVLATLSAVAALGVAEKMALAAVAAPLPVLSAGGAAGGAAAGSHPGVVGRLVTKLTHGQNSYSLWLGCATVLLLIVVLTQNLDEKNFRSQPAGAIALSTDVLKSANRQLPGRTVKGRHGSRYSRRGVLADSAKVLGYMPITTATTTSLHGKVVADGGGTISGADVTVWIGSTTSETVKTGKDGTFIFHSLDEGTAILTAKAEGYATTFWGEYVALLPMPGLDDPFTIQLERPVKMVGQVVNETGQPMPGAKVTVVKQFDQQKQIYNGASDYLKHGSYWRGLLPQQVVLADGNGRFELAGLKPGYVSLHVQHPARPDIIAEEIQAGVDDALLVLDRGVALEGRVLDGDQPVHGIQVKIQDGVEGFAGIEGTGATAVTDETGSFVVPGLQILRSDMAKWSFTASAETSSSIKIPKYLFSISRGEGTCTLEMNSADVGKEQSWSGSIDVRRFYGSRTQPNQFGSGQLIGSVELPADVVDDAIIEISNPVLIDMQQLVNGRFSFERLPAGKYWVSCRFSKDAPVYRQVIVPQSVEVREGQLHTVHLQPGTCTLKGKVLDSNGSGMSGSVSISTIDKLSPFYGTNTGHVAQFKVPASGDFEFRGLEPGKYCLGYSEGGQFSSQMVECRAGDVNYCEVRPAGLLWVNGRIGRNDGKPPGGIRVAFESKVESQGKSKRGAVTETDNRGNFNVHLSTGTYTMLVQPREKMYPETFEVEVDGGQTTIPLVTIGQGAASGIVVKQTGVGAALWRTANFYLVSPPLAGKLVTLSTIYPLSRTHDTVTLGGIKPGEYDLIVRSSELDDWPQHREIGESELFSSVMIPSVRVPDEAFAVVSLPLEAGRTVSLRCFPGEHGMRWVSPTFWIKDSDGARMVVEPERKDVAIRLGLAPGKYQFGVTLDSGEEQSVEFDVLATERHTEVQLQLK